MKESIYVDNRVLFIEYQATGDVVLRNRLIEEHIKLANYLAHRFSSRGEPVEDIRQVAYIGLLKAIERYDPSSANKFSSFAMPTIIGEIKRYFRDKTSLLHVPRGLQERRQAVQTATGQLTYKLGRPPLVAEIAESVRLTEEAVLEAQELGHASQLMSLEFATDSSEASGANATPHAFSGAPDAGFEHVHDRMAVKQAMLALDERDRILVYLRFFKSQTQSQVAKALGTSQMHVSRRETKILKELRAIMGPNARQETA